MDVRRELDPSRIRFILVEPQTAGNAGSVARALKNLGFSRLSLVRPCFALDDREALMMAVDAADILTGAVVHDGLDGALAGAHSVVGTSRRKGKHRRPHYRLDRFSGELSRLVAAGELALVFGREDSGLTDRELDRCTHLIHLPAADDYPSFNLAQAVLLTAYELRRAHPDSLDAEPLEPPAEQEAREAMYEHLAHALSAIGFLQQDTVEPIMRRMRRLLGRAAATEDEVRMLRGVARQVLWAAGRSDASTEDDER